MAIKKGNDAEGLNRLKADLKSGTPARAYIISGREDYLKEHYLTRLRRTILDGTMDEFNHKRLDGASLDMNELMEAVEAMPSFAEGTLVEVRDLDIFSLNENDTAQFIDIISDIPEWCCLVFIFDAIEYHTDGRRKKLADALSANVVTVTIDEQGKSELARWITSHFKAHNKRISPEDCEYLTFLCGSMMTNLNSEIEKIASWCEGDTVTREDIDAVAVPALEAVVFDLTDAIAARKFADAAAVLDKLLQLQNEPLQILGAVSTQFRRMYAAKVLKRNGTDTASIKKAVGTSSDFYLNKLLSGAAAFSEKRLASAMEQCAKADMSLKSFGSADDEPLTELLIGLSAWG